MRVVEGKPLSGNILSQEKTRERRI